jgi:hypothetical protein
VPLRRDTGQLAEPGAPGLERHRLAPAPVTTAPARSPPPQLGQLRTRSSSWIGLNRFGRSGYTGIGRPARSSARWNQASRRPRRRNRAGRSRSASRARAPRSAPPPARFCTGYRSGARDGCREDPVRARLRAGRRQTAADEQCRTPSPSGSAPSGVRCPGVPEAVVGVGAAALHDREAAPRRNRRGARQRSEARSTATGRTPAAPAARGRPRETREPVHLVVARQRAPRRNP